MRKNLFEINNEHKNHYTRKNIRINTTILKSSFWNYGERYITTECKITGTTAYTIAFKNTALGAALSEAADFLDVVMPIYNFIE